MTSRVRFESFSSAELAGPNGDSCWMAPRSASAWGSGGTCGCFVPGDKERHEVRTELMDRGQQQDDPDQACGRDREQARKERRAQVLTGRNGLRDHLFLRRRRLPPRQSVRPESGSPFIAGLLSLQSSERQSPSSCVWLLSCMV